MLLRRCVVSQRHHFCHSRGVSISTPSSLSLAHFSHQLSVYFKAADAAHTDVEVIPVLNAFDCALRVPNGVNVHDAFSIETGDSNKVLRIAKKSVGNSKVQLLLPYTTDLDVAVANGNVIVQDKVEGDVKVVVGCGDITVHKVRGQMVTLKTNGGSIQVSALVEGETVHLEASGSVQCKKLMANIARVRLGKGQVDSEFGAIYAPTCNITSTDQSEKVQLRVGNVHGCLRVTSEGLKSVEVNSVTGSLEVQDNGDKCRVVAHFDSWMDESASSIMVSGDVRVSLQPAVPIDVELHGMKITVGTGCKFLSKEVDQLDDNYAVFTGTLQAQEGSAATSSTGKINVESAKDDAMRTSFFMKRSSSDNEDRKSSSSRLFVHTSSGEITLDQLNWMDNIKRKHLK